MLKKTTFSGLIVLYIFLISVRVSIGYAQTNDDMDLPFDNSIALKYNWTIKLKDSTILTDVKMIGLRDSELFLRLDEAKITVLIDSISEISIKRNSMIWSLMAIGGGIGILTAVLSDNDVIDNPGAEIWWPAAFTISVTNTIVRILMDCFIGGLIGSIIGLGLDQRSLPIDNYIVDDNVNNTKMYLLKIFRIRQFY